MTRDALISVSLHLPASDEANYRAGLARQSRRGPHAPATARPPPLHQAATDPATRRTIEAWRDVRGQLARLLLATADGRDHPERVARLKQLTAEKERLERELAEAIPEFARQQALERSPHAKLLEVAARAARPSSTWSRFTRFEQDPQVKGKKGERRTPSYVGFVLAKGRPVRMVDLGPAQPIDEAVRTWREAIDTGGKRAPPPRSSAGWSGSRWPATSRPARRPCSSPPTAPLTGIPWAALPGDRPGTVLLEQYALATVPHAPFLLDRLTAPAPTDQTTAGLLLAVGGVAYDQAPKPVDDEKTRLELLAARPAETARGRGDGWADLPGTLQELDAVTRLAGAARRPPAPGRRGGHRAAAPGAAPRPLGPHRHPRLLRRSRRPLRPATRSQALRVHRPRARRRRPAQPAGPLGPGAGRRQPAQRRRRRPRPMTTWAS